MYCGKCKIGNMQRNSNYRAERPLLRLLMWCRFVHRNSICIHNTFQFIHKWQHSLHTKHMQYTNRRASTHARAFMHGTEATHTVKQLSYEKIACVVHMCLCVYLCLVRPVYSKCCCIDICMHIVYACMGFVIFSLSSWLIISNRETEKSNDLYSVNNVCARLNFAIDWRINSAITMRLLKPEWVHHDGKIVYFD